MPQHRPPLSIISYPLWVTDSNRSPVGRLTDGRKFCTSLEWQEINVPMSRSMPFVLYATSRNVCQLIHCDIGQVISIDMLPDDVLLEIFGFYVNGALDEDQCTKQEIEMWQSLVHVCLRWRSIVFGSPCRLNLRLVCETKTPAGDTLNVWPALPLFIWCNVDNLPESVDNVIAVLERSNLVCQIILKSVRSLHLEKVSAAMLEPFPELTRLHLSSSDETMPVLPDSFLGGSAPRLRKLYFRGIPFPGFLKLLLSATHLITLRLERIPHSGYISPEAMATALSTLTSLKILRLEFQSPRSRPDWASRRLPPLARPVLPVLTDFEFKGVSEYLDDLVAYIDAPRLKYLDITFFNQIIFDTPQFIQFISRTPRLKALERACVAFGNSIARVSLSSQKTSGYGELNVKISCGELDWQVSSLEQVCTLCLPPLDKLGHLYIYKARYSRPHWQDNIEDALWLELLHPFIAVKNLHLSKEFEPRIAPALQELVGATEVLPILQNIFLEGFQPSQLVQEGIRQFVASRQVTGHPIAVSRWDRGRSRTRF